jgi:predicted ribonuclease YlaK
MISRGADEEESNGHIRGRELENNNIIIDDNYSSDDDDVPLELPFDNI